MNETYVTIRGRLTADPTARTTRAGTPMTKIRIATSARRQVQPGQWEDTEPSFYDVVAYRSLAANMAVSLSRGQPVSVHGKQRIVSWQREDGSTWYGVEVEADAVGHDLTFGTTAFSRVGMGRSAAEWSPGEGVEPGRPGPPEWPPAEGAEPGRPDEDEGRSGVGDPEHDPYVVEPGPGRRIGEVARSGARTSADTSTGTSTDTRTGARTGARTGVSAGPSTGPKADTGPLVPPGKEAAA